MSRFIFVEDGEGRAGVGEVSREDPAAIAFAEETARLDLEGQRRGVPAWVMLGGSDPSPRPIGQVCFSKEEIEAALAIGVRTIKIKDLALASKDRDRSYALRIDLNGRDELERAASFKPELIEEPATLDRGAPLALDESLARPGGVERGLMLLEKKIVCAFVLKPVLLGGIRRCLELAAEAKKRGGEVIVTHYFDGPVAHAAATQLAFALDKGRFAHGLGWHRELEPSDVPQLEGGVLRAPRWAGVVAPEVRAELVRRSRCAK